MSGMGLDGGATYHQWAAVGGFLPGGTGPAGDPVAVCTVTILP